ncbi:hypothetical protein KIPB_011651, partial [Kipferlia bialata]
PIALAFSELMVMFAIEEGTARRALLVRSGAASALYRCMLTYPRDEDVMSTAVHAVYLLSKEESTRALLMESGCKQLAIGASEFLDLPDMLRHVIEIVNHLS